MEKNINKGVYILRNVKYFVGRGWGQKNQKHVNIIQWHYILLSFGFANYYYNMRRINMHINCGRIVLCPTALCLATQDKKKSIAFVLEFRMSFSRVQEAKSEARTLSFELIIKKLLIKIFKYKINLSRKTY